MAFSYITGYRQPNLLKVTLVLFVSDGDNFRQYYNWKIIRGERYLIRRRTGVKTSKPNSEVYRDFIIILWPVIRDFNHKIYPYQSRHNTQCSHNVLWISIKSRTRTEQICKDNWQIQPNLAVSFGENVSMIFLTDSDYDKNTRGE